LLLLPPLLLPLVPLLLSSDRFSAFSHIATTLAASVVAAPISLQ
jgi:hypothetical protein